MSEKKQTAVGWLLEYCERENWSIPNDIISYAKEMGKQQILDAHTFAHSQFGSGKIMPSEQEQQEFAEQYYSQKYNQ